MAAKNKSKAAVTNVAQQQVAATTEYRITGKVQEADGTPVPRAKVEAFSKHLRREESLAKAATNSQGQYKITFKLPAKDPALDIVLRAFDRAGTEIASSPVLFDVKPEMTVDLVKDNAVFRGPSLFQQWQEALEPLLDKLDPKDITPEDAAFLADKTGLDRDDVAHYVQSQLLAARTGLPAMAFVAFGKAQLPMNLSALLAQEPEMHRQALEDGIEENIIPENFREQIDAMLKGLQQASINTALNDPGLEGRHSLGELFTAAGISPNLRKIFLERYQAHDGEIEPFWEALRNDPNFNQNGTVDDLQTGLQLAMLTQNHVPLVKELLALLEKGEMTSLQDLTGFERGDWLDLILKKIGEQTVGTPPDIPGETEEERAGNYADILMRILADAFPTARMAKQIAQENLPEETDLRHFLANNPRFELREQPVMEYLKKHPHALDGVNDPEKTIRDLQARQRLFHLLPGNRRHEVMRELLNKEAGMDDDRVGQDDCSIYSGRNQSRYAQSDRASQAVGGGIETPARRAAQLVRPAQYRRRD